MPDFKSDEAIIFSYYIILLIVHNIKILKLTINIFMSINFFKKFNKNYDKIILYKLI